MANMPLTQDCLAQLIDSTTGPYNSPGTHSTSLYLALLASVEQRIALERAFIELYDTSTQCHAYQKYTRNLQNMDTFIFLIYT